MGWRGVARSVNAEINRAAREAERQRRVRQKEIETMEAAEAVRAHDTYITALTTIHHEQREPIDWRGMLNRSAPTEPVRSTAIEQRRRRELDRYSPSWLENLLNLEKGKRRKLENRLRDAIQQEERAYAVAVEKWKQDTTAWKRGVELARRVLDGDEEAWAEAIYTQSVFLAPDERSNHDPTQVSAMGQGEFKIDNKNVSMSIHTFGQELVPTEARKQLQSGKLSTRNMPKGQYWDIYLNYVASCALRIATEIFALLPIDMIFVTILEERLNPATGHVEPMPILSVQVPRRTLDIINLRSAQAGAALTQFNHAIDFRKTQGFRAIEPLMP